MEFSQRLSVHTANLLLLILFHVIPIFMTAGYSFTQYNVLQAPEFIGLEKLQ